MVLCMQGKQKMHMQAGTSKDSKQKSAGKSHKFKVNKEQRGSAGPMREGSHNLQQSKPHQQQHHQPQQRDVSSEPLLSTSASAASETSPTSPPLSPSTCSSGRAAPVLVPLGGRVADSPGTSQEGARPDVVYASVWAIFRSVTHCFNGVNVLRTVAFVLVVDARMHCVRLFLVML